MKNQTYTEEQINGLLDKLNEIKREHDLLRIEVALLRTLLTEATLQSSPLGQALDPRPSTLDFPSSLSPSPLP
jgi:hypothetical protein